MLRSIMGLVARHVPSDVQSVQLISFDVPHAAEIVLIPLYVLVQIRTMMTELAPHANVKHLHLFLEC